MSEPIKEELIKYIDELFTKYSDNSYMLNRIQFHIQNLSSTLEMECKKHDEKINRMNELVNEQENFYKIFLSKHQYYYMPYNNIYYEYDGKTYKIIHEDDIHYHLLSTITNEGKLTVWKHKTKQTLLKKIKERNLFTSVPETYTIQNVLTLLSPFFNNKNEIKYFLTVIGDCILKKNSQNQNNPLMFFVNSDLRKVISLIDSIAYITTGNSIMSNFVSKYHETHNLSLYRIIGVNHISFDLFKNVLNTIAIEFLCVATHYSERYTNSDNYLHTKSDTDLRNLSFFFVQNSISTIVEQFMEQCIEHADDKNTITWKNMHYIWKLHLSCMNVPNVLYANTLKNTLKEKMKFLEEGSDVVFLGITSKSLPSVSSFLSFWEQHISIENENEFDNEYEIDELLTLYKSQPLNTHTHIRDTEMINIIYHYFSPTVEVIDNKYITNIKCNLWDKQQDVKAFLTHYKENKQKEINNQKIHAKKENDLLSLDDLYENYKKYFHAKYIIEKNASPIVSKQFFEKAVCYYLMIYIEFDKFVSSEWLQNDDTI
jgi:hypothetical protein